MSVTGAIKENRSDTKVPIVVVLSGHRRGYSQSLTEPTYRIFLEPGEAVTFIPPGGEVTTGFHATLHRIGDSYEVAVSPGHEIWINGEKVKESHVLEHGDLLEIGHGGPMIRYRIYPKGVLHTKNLAQIYADCINGAYADGHTGLARTSRFLSSFTYDLVTQTTIWFRIWILIIVSLLAVSIVFLVLQNLQLQKRVTTEDVRIGSIEEKLEHHDINALTRGDLLELQKEVNTQLSETIQRLTTLEESAGKAADIIAGAIPAVVFLVGAYGFMEPDTNRLFRYELTNGQITRYTMDEEEPPVEIVFTGTAFVISASGDLLTNRHVIQPWEGDARASVAQGRDLVPVILKMFAYFPGREVAVDVEVYQTDERADLALLKPQQEMDNFRPFEFETRVPKPGEEVLLLGYPTGLQALVARTSPEFLESIAPDGTIDFWVIIERLARAGYIEPLASRGIVSQVTKQFVVYDAETTFGGSGGPALNMDGRVIAINTAVIPEFGGSNLGIPVENARELTETVQ